MPLKLTLEQKEKFIDVLGKAYDLQGFKHMLSLKLGYRLEDEFGLDRGKKYIIGDVVTQADDGGWVESLALGAVAGNPNHIYLGQFVASLQIKPVEKQGQENVSVAAPVPAAEEPRIGETGDNLEKAVRKRAPLMAFGIFTNRLIGLGPRVCRIEYPEGRAQGTGWLVGPDLVLTAYHVIEEVDNGRKGLTPADIFCRFDYAAEPDQQRRPNGRTCRLAEPWLLDKSPYSQSDLMVSNADPSPEELDYALIRLKENVSDDVLSTGVRRGFIEIMENAPVMSANDFVVIPQHPDGRPLELAFGEILNYNNNATRVRYDTNTEPGSSGSACFTIELVPFALHHASGPEKNLQYNQAVPLRAIIKAMIKKGTVNPFWKPS